MAWSRTRYEELVEILRSTSRKPDEYPQEIRDYLKLAEGEVFEKEVAGHVYKNYVWKAKNRTADAPLYIYLHGGGWAVGHEDCDCYYGSYMAHQIGGVVVDVDYTTSFDGDLDVMYAQVRDAVDFAFSHAEEFGCSPERVVIGGFSAGGHLTAGVVLRMIEEGQMPFAGVILAYAPLDLRRKPQVAPATDRDKVMQVRGAAYEELVLRGDDGRRQHYIESPLLAPKTMLAKLPRMMVISAQLCEFREQDEELARILAQIGIEATACRFTFSAHGFMPHFRQEWEEASRRTARFIRSC